MHTFYADSNARFTQNLGFDCWTKDPEEMAEVFNRCFTMEQKFKEGTARVNNRNGLKEVVSSTEEVKDMLSTSQEIKKNH